MIAAGSNFLASRLAYFPTSRSPRTLPRLPPYASRVPKRDALLPIQNRKGSTPLDGGQLLPLEWVTSRLKRRNQPPNGYVPTPTGTPIPPPCPHRHVKIFSLTETVFTSHVALTFRSAHCRLGAQECRPEGRRYIYSSSATGAARVPLTLAMRKARMKASMSPSRTRSGSPVSSRVRRSFTMR